MPARKRNPHRPNLAELSAPWSSVEWIAICRGCGHSATVPPEALHRLMSRLGGSVAAANVHPKLKCSACGGSETTTTTVRLAPAGTPMLPRGLQAELGIVDVPLKASLSRRGSRLFR